MTREEKIKSYQENIFNAILDPKGISKEDFEYLTEVIPTYLKIVLDIEDMEISFDDIEGGNFNRLTNKITISTDYAQFKENNIDNFLSLANLIQVCSHELYHALDAKELKTSNSNREYLGQKYIGVANLATFIPSKMQEYLDFTDAMYLLSRSECFARQGALLMLKNFVNDMKNYVVDDLSSHKDLLPQWEQLIQYEQEVLEHGDNGNCPEVEPLAWEYYEKITQFSRLGTFVQYEEQKEKENMQQAILKKSLLPLIKQDLLQVSELILKNSKFESFASEEEVEWFVATQDISELYDERILNNLLTYSKEHPERKKLQITCQFILEQVQKKQQRNQEKAFQEEFRQEL